MNIREVLNFSRSLRFPRLQYDFDAAVFFLFESFIGSGRRFERQRVRDYKRRIDLSAVDHFEQWLGVLLNVGLTGFQSQAFIE